MEDELLKRNTDCVYFLASPFTCKKGAECEYRHSDMARLNPRDCWYWLSGNCLNPTCAFRHPPLEVHTEASSGATASVVNQSSVPATKSTVPCYFYFNGFCNKGDRCPFLHDPDNTYSLKPKMANTPADIPVQPVDTKTSGKSNMETAPANNHYSLCEMAVKSGDRLQVQQQASNNLLTLSASPQAFSPDYDETVAVKTASLQTAEDLPKSEYEPSLGSDQSSEDLIDGNIVRDEWCESSPGFDVLVDGRTEDIAYEDDPDYLHAFDRNDGDHENLFMRHGYVDPNDYDERIFFRNGLHDPFEILDAEQRSDLGKYSHSPSPRHTVDRKVGRIVSHKRKLLSVEFPAGGGNSVDLRDYLRKRRMVDGYLERHDLVHRRDERRDRFRKHAPSQRLHRRVESKIERNGVGLARRRSSVVDAYERGRPRDSHHINQSREYQQRNRSPDYKRGSSLKRERNPPVSITFAGPKSLAEIKGEKRASRRSIGNGSVDFDGPKPLSEILKDKKKPTSTGDGSIINGSF